MKLPRRKRKLGEQTYLSDYRPPRTESRGAGVFKVLGAVMDWPVTIAGGLGRVAAYVWEKWPRWLSIPVIALCLAGAVYLLVFMFMWLTFSDPVTGEF